MSMLFTQNYDVIEEEEDEYASFVADVYIPRTEELGLRNVGGFYVEMGFGPRIIAVHAAEDLEELSRTLVSREFRDLTFGLKSLVYNYRNTVFEPTGRTQPQQETYKIQKNVWKLNQYYDVKPELKLAYKEHILKEHLPAMREIDYVQVIGGWNVVLGGVSEIMAELTFKNPQDIGRLMNNDNFRKVTTKLRRKYVRNYASRVLRCTERFGDLF